MLKFICDRCGRDMGTTSEPVIHEGPNTHIAFDICKDFYIEKPGWEYEYNNRQKITLCTECSTKFLNWLNNEEVCDG